MAKKPVLSRAQADAFEALKGLPSVRSTTITVDGTSRVFQSEAGSALVVLGLQSFDTNAGMMVNARNLDDIEYTIGE